MASVFGHAILAGSLGTALPKVLRKPSVIICGIICSMLPDIDVIGFSFGIRYEDLWGHRGMTHSIFFGVILGLLLGWLLHYKINLKDRLITSLYYVICTVSHGVLDGLTTGGLGVAYFSPFDPTRYFLPWRMIQVSPLSIASFFNKWGLRVLESEFFWIGIPSIIFMAAVYFIRKLRKSNGARLK